MEVLSQEEFTRSVNQINRNLERTYGEMHDDEVTTRRIEGTKADSIRRLAAYYRELHSIGAFIEEETGAKRDLHEICGVIQHEMQKRMFTPKTVWQVYDVLPDDCKRAWRSIANTTKSGTPKVVVSEVETANKYASTIEHINEIDNIDYSEFPKGFRLQVAERVYKLYRHHDKEWTKHDLTVVKHSDGLNINNPYSAIIRLHKGEPYEGMALDGLDIFIKACKDLRKVYQTMIFDKDGNRRVSLEEERNIYNGWAALTGMILPSKNNKWKRDLLGWCKIFLKKVELKSKSGAAKWSRKLVHLEEMDKDMYRGITREEITKNQKRMMLAFKDFIEWFPELLFIHDTFVSGMEPVRAEHSVRMHEKLSQSA